ncbi:MAG: hypothetical protein CMJ62_07410 [Planctomycetaceae bacterium]|nr:hypothetical protein [Planctomycetaceae bacterium]
MRAQRRVLALVLLLQLIFLDQAFSQGRVAWVPTLEMAQQIAAQNNQLILLHFWSPTCAPCVRLEHTVFADPSVSQALARDYVPVKINAEQTPETAKRYGISRIPGDVVISPTGQVLHHGPSPMTVRAFVAHFQQIAAANQSLPGKLAANSGPSITRGATNRAPMAWQQNPLTQRSPAGNTSSPPAQQGSRYRNPDVYSDTVASPPYQTGTSGTLPYNVSPSETVAPRYSVDQEQPVINRHDYQQQPVTGRQPVVQSNAPAGNSYVSPERQLSVRPGNQYGNNSNPLTGNVTPGNGGRGAPLYQQGPPAVAQEVGIHASPTTGLDGYCPVTLGERSRWQLGDPRWGAIHRGKTYLFAGLAEQQRFMANPDFYAPMLSGHDSVVYIEQGRLVPGTREHGVFYRQQVYLFSSEESLQRFWQGPERFHAAAFQAMRQTLSSQR